MKVLHRVALMILLVAGMQAPLPLLATPTLAQRAPSAGCIVRVAVALTDSSRRAELHTLMVLAKGERAPAVASPAGVDRRSTTSHTFAFRLPNSACGRPFAMTGTLGCAAADGWSASVTSFRLPNAGFSTASEFVSPEAC